MTSLLKNYYYMTKPGIVRGNLLTVIAGFLLASQGVIDTKTFLGVVIGTALVIASACVVNNYIDRDIDRKMERTKKRALVTGAVSLRSATLFALILGCIGFGLLLALTNPLTFYVGVLAYVFYVVIYGVAKRASYHGTLVGTIPGALPPVAGYVAVTGALDLAAVILFFIIVFWQMPHFYAIAIYRRKDYRAAGIPVISLVKGIAATKRAIMWYIVAFAISAVCLAVAGYVGLTYVVTMVALSVLWFALGLRGLRKASGDAWAKMMFRFSLIVTLVFSVLISVDYLLI
jgi:protoheme IX farnesyltransferase